MKVKTRSSKFLLEVCIAFAVVILATLYVFAH